MDSATSTEKTDAAPPAKKNQGANKINLYVAMAIMIGVGVGGYLNMATTVSFPLMAIGILLICKFVLKELGDIHEKLNK